MSKSTDPLQISSKTTYYNNNKKGLTTEGIFRLSGATSEVILLEDKINMSSPDERKQINADEFDIHTLTSLVKKYLRELPEPVIPNEFHEKFQDIGNSRLCELGNMY